MLGKNILKKSDIARTKNRKNIQQNTYSTRWKCLEEVVRAQDRSRDNFHNKMNTLAKMKIPRTISKFINSLKQTVRMKMRHEGGTPFSIVRGMFLKWDSDNSGCLNASELERCFISLGVETTASQRDEIVKYYHDADAGEGGMTYNKLLDDIQRDEPSMLEQVAADFEEIDVSERFAIKQDAFVKMPPLVSSFIDCLKDVLSRKLTYGGTAYSVLREAFCRFDWDYSSALDAEEFAKAMKYSLGIPMSPEQAAEIVKFYDRKGVKEFNFEALMEDMASCSNSDVIAHPQPSAEEVREAQNRLKTNPFAVTQFRAKPNKIVEHFKRNLRLLLGEKIAKSGGTMQSWMREAFVVWDPLYSGKMKHWRYLQGATKRIGIKLTQEESMAIMRCYESTSLAGEREVHYDAIIKDIVQNEPNILCKNSPGANISMPDNVSRVMQRLIAAMNKFVRKSKGKLAPRDVLMGTCMRKDATPVTGRLSTHKTNEMLTALKVVVSEEDVVAVVNWYDTDGTGVLDYHELIRELYGNDDLLMKRDRSTYAADGYTMDHTIVKPPPVSLNNVLPCGRSNLPVRSQSASRARRTIQSTKDAAVTLESTGGWMGSVGDVAHNPTKSCADMFASQSNTKENEALHTLNSTADSKSSTLSGTGPCQPVRDLPAMASNLSKYTSSIDFTKDNKELEESKDLIRRQKEKHDAEKFQKTRYVTGNIAACGEGKQSKSQSGLHYSATASSAMKQKASTSTSSKQSFGSSNSSKRKKGQSKVRSDILRAAKSQTLLVEKIEILKRLESVEQQSKDVKDDYKARQAKKLLRQSKGNSVKSTVGDENILNV